MPHDEGDRSDCQPSTTTIALTQPPASGNRGRQFDLSPSTQGMIFVILQRPFINTTLLHSGHVVNLLSSCTLSPLLQTHPSSVLLIVYKWWFFLYCHFYSFYNFIVVLAFGLQWCHKKLESSSFFFWNIYTFWYFPTNKVFIFEAIQKLKLCNSLHANPMSRISQKRSLQFFMLYSFWAIAMDWLEGA